jgi:hypothetical protein
VEEIGAVGCKVGEYKEGKVKTGEENGRKGQKKTLCGENRKWDKKGQSRLIFGQRGRER